MNNTYTIVQKKKFEIKHSKLLLIILKTRTQEDSNGLNTATLIDHINRNNLYIILISAILLYRFTYNFIILFIYTSINT